MQTRSAPTILLAMLSLIEATPSGTDQTYRLKFGLRDGYQVIAQGAIGALDGLNVLIDTGSIPGMVDARICKKLGLEVRRGEIVTFGHKTCVRSTTLPDVKVGPIRADAVFVGIADLSFLGVPHVDAIIGLDVLTRSSFSIDYERRLLTFGSILARDPSMHLDVTPPFLTVQVELDGHPFCLLVDTGSKDVVLFKRRLRGRLSNLLVLGDKLLYHVGGVSRLQRVLLPHVEAGDRTIVGLEGFLSNADVDGYPSDVDGILGVRAIASRRADFDFERNRLGWQ